MASKKVKEVNAEETVEEVKEKLLSCIRDGIKDGIKDDNEPFERTTETVGDVAQRHHSRTRPHCAGLLRNAAYEQLYDLHYRHFVPCDAVHRQG